MIFKVQLSEKSVRSFQALSVFQIFKFKELLKFSYECISIFQTPPSKVSSDISCSDESDDILANLAINDSNSWILSSFHLYFSYNLDVVENVTVMSYESGKSSFL